MNWKGYGSKQVGPNLRSYHICMKGQVTTNFWTFISTWNLQKMTRGLFIPLSCSAHTCYMPCKLMYFLSQKTRCFLFPQKSPHKICQHLTAWSCINMTITATGILAFAVGITWLTLARRKTNPHCPYTSCLVAHISVPLHVIMSSMKINYLSQWNVK